MSEGDIRAARTYDVRLREVADEWRRMVINPLTDSLIDRAYHQGVLPLPPLRIDGDGVWTRKEPWYVAVDG